MAGNQSNYARRIYLWVFMRFRRGDGRKTEAGCTRVLQLGQLFHVFCETAFVNDLLFLSLLVGLPPIWICITSRPRCLKPKNKDAKSWTRLEFGWYASIWIDLLQHSLVNRRRSRKTSTLFSSYSMLSFFLSLDDSIVRNAKEWYKKSQYNTTVSSIVTLISSFLTYSFF